MVKSKELVSSILGGIYQNTQKINALIPSAWQWAERYRTYKNERVSYAASKLEPWKAVLECMNPMQVILKSRKITASEQMLNRNFWLMEQYPHCNFALAFPFQETQADAFSRARVNPAVRDSSRLQMTIKEDTLERKSFWHHLSTGEAEQFLYIYGVMTSGKEPGDKFRSLAVKGVSYDEVQMIPAESHAVIDQAQMPDEQFLKWCSGTPTTPGNTLSAILWEPSSQNLCLFKCPSCGNWNNLTVKDNIFYRPFNSQGRMHHEFGYPLDEMNDVKNAYIGCARCAASLEHLRGRYGDLGADGKVEWVPQYPAHAGYMDGFFVNKMILGLEPTLRILTHLMSPQNSNRRKTNEILGYPYVGDDSPFSLQAMSASLLKDVTFDEVPHDEFDLFIATVDWGIPSWYAIHGLTHKDGKIMSVLLELGHTFGTDERKHGEELNARFAKRWPNLKLIICDIGYSVGRERDFYETFGQKHVYVVDARIGNIQDTREQFNVDVRRVRQTRVIKAPRDYLLENFERLIDDVETRWFVPFADPDKMFDEIPLRKYLGHCENVYRQPVSNWNVVRREVVEIKTERTVYYKDAGSPDHTLMLFAYAALLSNQVLMRVLVPQKIQVML